MHVMFVASCNPHRWVNKCKPVICPKNGSVCTPSDKGSCIALDGIRCILVRSTSMAMSVRASLILLLFFRAEKPICEDVPIACHEVYHRGGFKEHLSRTTISRVLRANPPSHTSRFHLYLCEHLHLFQPPHRHCLAGNGFRPADKKNMRCSDNNSIARPRGSRKWPRVKQRPVCEWRGAHASGSVSSQLTTANSCTLLQDEPPPCFDVLPRPMLPPNSSRSLLPRTISSRSGTSSRRACAARGLRTRCLLTYSAVRKQAQIA